MKATKIFVILMALACFGMTASMASDASFALQSLLLPGLTGAGLVLGFFLPTKK